jgi:hypothetical protein
MKAILPAILLALLAACASNNKPKGIDAPNAAIGGQVEIALRDAHKWLLTRPGGAGLRAFDPKRDRLTVTVKEPIAYRDGQPVLFWRNGRNDRDGWVGATATATQIVMARGSDGRLVNHEAKHVVLELNGKVAESRSHAKAFFPEGSNVF